MLWERGRNTSWSWGPRGWLGRGREGVGRGGLQADRQGRDGMEGGRFLEGGLLGRGREGWAKEDRPAGREGGRVGEGVMKVEIKA